MLEFGAVCSSCPDDRSVCRVVELVVRYVTEQDPPISSECEEEENDWVIRLGGSASAVVRVLPPGSHEYAGYWYVIVTPSVREPLDYLLAVVSAAAIAMLCGGRFVDGYQAVASVDDSAYDILLRVLALRGSSIDEIWRDLRRPV